MITCVNGHENPAGSTYCQVCNVYIDSTAEPTPPPPPDPEPVPPVTTLVTVKITLSTAQLTIDAGGEGSCELTIESGSEQPDEFVVELQGVSWGQVEPWLVPLGPKASGTAHITFRPPAGLRALDPVPFSVVVTPKSDPEKKATADGTIVVAVTVQPTARIEPARSSGPVEGVHTITVANPGAQPLEIEFNPIDVEGALLFELTPQSVSVPAHGEASTKLVARAREKLARGSSPVTHPFQVDVMTGSPPPITLEAAMEQTTARWKPIIIGAAAVFAAIVIAFVIRAVNAEDEVAVTEFVAPSVIGLTVPEAQNALTAAGFTPAVVRVGETFGTPTVTDQSPDPGFVTTEKGTVVTLFAPNKRLKFPVDVLTLKEIPQPGPVGP